MKKEGRECDRRAGKERGRIHKENMCSIQKTGGKKEKV